MKHLRKRVPIVLLFTTKNKLSIFIRTARVVRDIFAKRYGNLDVIVKYTSIHH